MTERLVGDIIDRTLNSWLLGTYSAQFNSLSANLTATGTEINCTLPPGEIGTGSLIAIDDELMYVAERDATNNRLIVVRQVRGTTAATHASGTAIEINPRFPRFLVRQMMIEEIDAWPENLYQPKTFTASVAASGTVIPVEGEVEDATVHGVIRVRRASLSFFDARLRRTNGYDVTGDFGGAGGIIAITEEVGMTTSFDVTVACGFNTDPIDDFGDECDLLADVGLSKGMVEIAELGAAYRLLTGRGAVRLYPEAQGQSRTVQEVGAQDIPAFARSLLALRERRAVAETERLVSRYGFGGG